MGFVSQGVRRRFCSGRNRCSKAKAVGKVGCISGAGTRRVPLDWMLHIEQGMPDGCLWTMYDPQMCCFWPTELNN